MEMAARACMRRFVRFLLGLAGLLISPAAFAQSSAQASASPASARVTPGFTYTLRVTSGTPDAQPGISGGPGTMSYVGRVQWSNGRGRVDVVEGGIESLFTAGDYLLVDSSTVTVVHPAKREYFVLAPDDSANGGFAAMTSLMQLSDEKVVLDSIGAGDTISGVPTRRYRMTVAFNMSMLGGSIQQRLGTESVTDYWVGVVPGLSGNPLLRSNGLASATLPATFKTLSARVDSAAAKMGHTLPLRTSAITRVIVGPGRIIQTQQSSLVSDLKRTGIDQSLLMIPEGFKKVAMPN
jgi:hypothetical protein